MNQKSSVAQITNSLQRVLTSDTRDGMLHMIFKLGQCAEQNWRKLRGFNHLADVIQGVNFKDGIKQTQTETAAA